MTDEEMNEARREWIEERKPSEYLGLVGALLIGVAIGIVIGSVF